MYRQIETLLFDNKPYTGFLCHSSFGRGSMLNLKHNNAPQNCRESNKNCRYVYNTTSRRLLNLISFCMFLHFLHLLSTLFSIYIYSSYSSHSCCAVIPYSLSIVTSDFPAWPARLLLIYLQLLLGNI